MSATLLASWGYAAAKALGDGGLQWRARKVYIEFENVVSPSNPVSVPAVAALDETHGAAYYAGLSSSATRDYLRVDLLAAPLLGVADGYEGYFPDGHGNVLRLFAQTAGVVGFHGRTFSDAANSKVCGVALVVAPAELDQTQDVVIMRSYYSTGEQILKLPNSQIGVSLEIPFILPD